jgi:hypothetical protein
MKQCKWNLMNGNLKRKTNKCTFAHNYYVYENVGTEYYTHV